LLNDLWVSVTEIRALGLSDTLSGTDVANNRSSYTSKVLRVKGITLMGSDSWYHQTECTELDLSWYKSV